MLATSNRNDFERYAAEGLRRAVATK